MRQIGYYFFKYWISLGLFFYFKKIRITGLDDMPSNKPTLLLSNHQNALLDVLLIAAKSNLKPWYLTRSDVFKNKLFSPLFYFLQMLPIYRMRDGKDTLAKNEAIFNRCGDLLADRQTLLIFPEANHNLKRRVRPLSKGFTRIIFKALEKNPELDINLVPVGQNYKSAASFPDSAALCFGKPIAVQDLLEENTNKTVSQIKLTVTKQLKQLTTHIDSETGYDYILTALKNEGIDFLNPELANNSIKNLDAKGFLKTEAKHQVLNKIMKWIFVLFNFPLVFVWRTFVKPKVPEPEFMSTFRFAFSMIAYPICYLFFLVALANVYSIKKACLIIVLHAFCNILFVKFALTSSVQRK
ncbi:1-acyl-sn-glycerol-3-phosphate acyltransferase [Croceitalea marina]|uniref:1-acyl-sn-glycerol-3-phosphate acyltransferase n=1 Tax=Croceitalea marina TaxID=1775166 RepID=A0ABW5MRI0_9FLAO